MGFEKNYRRDIDGLRAVAVVSVVLNHLNYSFLPGGFVGVDIFFVISGFLITSQVRQEILGGSFSLAAFYKRRVNRIVPALLVVVVATLSAGVVLASPVDLVLSCRSALYALVGASNIFFWLEYGNYFAGTASEAPLLHTWSLGVEEQFYLIWPLVVWLLVTRAKQFALWPLAAGTVAALALSQIAIGVVASASYYLLPARLFELMMGGCLSWAVCQWSAPSRRVAGGCALVGLALIAGSLILLSKASAFPGFNALWPCLGSSLLIWAGRSEHMLSGVLVNRPMVFIGLISYSLYLWHWPLIAYLNYVGIAIDALTGVAVGLASMGLAWLSWKFIEVPMRRSGAARTTVQVLLKRFALPLAAVGATTAAVAMTGGFPSRFDPLVVSYEHALGSRPEVLRSGCHVPTALYATPMNLKCRLGARKSDADGLLIGDSFANHFTGMLDVLAQAEGLSLIDYTMDGCPPLLDFDNGAARTYAERCRKRNEAAFAQIATGKFRRVILAASWPREVAAGEALNNSIEHVLKTGAQLTIVFNNSRIDGASSCPIRRVMYGSMQRSCEAARARRPDYFAAIQARYPAVHFLDPDQVICPDDKCSPVLEGVLLYRDGVHLNDLGSRLIGRSLLRLGAKL